MTAKLLTFLDFFAGSGLVELALREQWACVWANDIEPKKAAIHALNFDHSAYHVGDVAAVEPRDLPAPVDLAWSSFPCQDLSLAGWRRGMASSRSGAFWAFWRLMRDLHDQGTRPPLIVLENVLGLLHGDDFAGLCEALAALGMRFGALVMDAERFVPQSRPRVFIIAVDASIETDSFEHAQPTTSPWLHPRLLTAFAGLPDELQRRWVWWKVGVPPERTATFDDLYEENPEGVVWNDLAQTGRLLAMMSPSNHAKVVEAQRLGRRSVGLLYRRTRKDGQRAEVRFDGVAGCLRTPNGGSSRQTVLVVEGDSVRSRLLSPREAARLMGAPDGFRLLPNYNDTYRAMGDGVVVPVVRWLSNELLTPLARLARTNATDGRAIPAISIHRERSDALAERWLSASARK